MFSFKAIATGFPGIAAIGAILLATMGMWAWIIFLLAGLTAAIAIVCLRSR